MACASCCASSAVTKGLVIRRCRELPFEDVWAMFGEGRHPHIERIYETRLAPFMTQVWGLASMHPHVYLPSFWTDAPPNHLLPSLLFCSTGQPRLLEGPAALLPQRPVLPGGHGEALLPSDTALQPWLLHVYKLKC